MAFSRPYSSKEGCWFTNRGFAAVASEDPSLELVTAGPDQVGLQADLQQRAASWHCRSRHLARMLSGELKWALSVAQNCFAYLLIRKLWYRGRWSTRLRSSSCSRSACEYRRWCYSCWCWIVHIDTVEGTTMALRQWLKTTPVDRAEMGERGRRLFAERFNFASWLKSYSCIWKCLRNRPIRWCWWIRILMKAPAFVCSIVWPGCYGSLYGFCCSDQLRLRCMLGVAGYLGALVLILHLVVMFTAKLAFGLLGT